VRVHVIGYGNPFRQDDGVGHVLAPQVAAWLEGRGETVTLHLDHQLLPEVAADLADAEMVLFVDASVSVVSSEVGYMFVPVVPDGGSESLNIHSFGPGWILRLAEELGHPLREAWMLSVSGVSFDFDDALTPECVERVVAAFAAFRKWWEERSAVEPPWK